MTREEFIDQSFLKLLHNWTNLAALAGTMVILALALLDFTVTPENFKTFLIYRVITAMVFLLIYIFTKRKMTWKRLHISIITATISVSTMVALMIARYGGHKSAYFGGMIIIVIFVTTISPPIKRWETFTAILYAAIIYAIYVIPITMYDSITDMAFFVNANFFILSSAISVIFIRHFIFKRFRNEFGLQYDIDEQRKRLSLYSAELERDVNKKEAAILTSEMKFKELFENANDGIVVSNRDGIIIEANKRFSEITGFDRESLIGTNIKILEANRDKEGTMNMQNRVPGGEPVIYEIGYFRKDGKKVDLEVSSRPININGEIYIQSLYRDITEKKRLQNQLFQAQKMESMGILAASIAHDFDNIITSIMGNIEMLKNQNDLNDRDIRRINLMENSARKARNLLTGLLSFARKSNYQKGTINLNKVIEGTIELMRTTMAKREIEVIMQLEDSASYVMGDGNMLSQVIMNLTVNAIEAMPSGGKITISTSVHKSEGHLEPMLKTGKYALLRFSDTGKGIPPELKDKIFEPFFTTKKEGQGTGLGLSIVYRIIKEHDGAITVESNSHEGTTFKIYLPVAEGFQSDIQKDIERKRILIVDDEIDMLNFIKDLLESQGYSVLPLSDPLEALRIDKRLLDDIDIIITDIMMPHLNGKELIRHLKTLKPFIKVIAISAHDIWNIGKRDGYIDAFVSKPFEGIYLMSVIKRVMGSEETSPAQ